MKGINLIVCACLALTQNAFAKNESDGANPSTREELSRVYGKLNALVTHANAARVALAEAAQKDRIPPQVPTQISKTEQRNIIALAAQELRSDWFSHVRGLITQRADLTQESELVRLYFSYVVIQDMIDFDDLVRVTDAVDEATASARFAQALFNFSSAICEARANGIHSANLIGNREEVYGESLIDFGQEDALFNRDLGLARSALDSADRTLNRVTEEGRALQAEIKVNKAQLEEAEELAATLPAELRVPFERPWGYPLVDRGGHLYTPKDWQKMREDFDRAPTQEGKANFFVRAFMTCARILSGVKPPPGDATK